MAARTGIAALLSRFAATVAVITPRRAAETAVVTLLLSATEGIGLLLLVPLLDLVGLQDDGTRAGTLAGISQQVGRAFAAIGLRPTLGPVLGVYVAAVGLQGVLQWRHSILTALVQQDVVTRLRQRLYTAIAGMRWTAFVRTRASDYTQRLSGDVDRVGVAAISLIDVLVLAATSLVYVAVAFRVSPIMTAGVLVAGTAMAILVRGRIRHARDIGEQASAAWTRFHGVLAEHLASLKLARSYGAEARHAGAFTRAIAGVSHVGIDSVRSYARLRLELSVGSAAVLAAIVYVSYAVVGVSTAQLLVLLFLFARLVPRLSSIHERAQGLAASLPAFAAVTEAERHALAGAEPPVGTSRPISLTTAITLDDVRFSYSGEPGAASAVRGVTLTIPAGRTTAIVGPSGSGKSTIADLLLGLLQPTTGRVLVDDMPLDPERLPAWRARIGYVAQDTFLFHDTVRSNLLWANPEATEGEVRRALRLAAAESFVSALPLGLDTLVGERGVLISGGERQRLSLARALLRAPSVLILDEATSALDSENETRIQLAIDGLHEHMTIVVITHRLSTIRGADLIHVLDRGEIVDSGTWEALAGRPGRFRELCLAQGIDDRPVSSASPS